MRPTCGVVLTSVEGPVVVAGHSYGGSVMSEAGDGGADVRALVFIASFQPDVGESTGGLAAKSPGGELGPALDTLPFPYSDGVGNDLYIKQDEFHRVFAADVPEEMTALMAATQRPIAANALEDTATNAAWKQIEVVEPGDARGPRDSRGLDALHVGARELAHGGDPRLPRRHRLAAGGGGPTDRRRREGDRELSRTSIAPSTRDPSPGKPAGEICAPSRLSTDLPEADHVDGHSLPDPVVGRTHGRRAGPPPGRDVPASFKHRRIDMLGVVLIGIGVALGGGLLRDLLLDTLPTVVRSNWYLLVAAAAALLGMTLERVISRGHAIIDTLDAVVIGLFGAIGTSKALALGVPAVPAIAIGVLAAVGGSILRDVWMGLPVAFLHVGSFYALAAGAGTTLLFALVAWRSTCRSRPQPGSRSPPQCGSRRFDSAGRCPRTWVRTPATSAPTSDEAGAEGWRGFGRGSEPSPALRERDASLCA